MLNLIPISMQYDQGASQTRFSLIKDTTMATGVREYVPGDRFSWIHWKSFAKNGELRTKEFEDRNVTKYVCAQLTVLCKRTLSR